MVRYDAWSTDEEAEEETEFVPLLSSDGILWIIIAVLCGAAIIGAVTIHDLSMQMNHIQQICRQNS
jgi:hypothetical protein